MTADLPDDDAPCPTSAPAGFGAAAAAVLVFTSSAAVLVVEITALRLLAPYLGLTLETSTLVIGIALSAIALGSWAGGRISDRVDPRRLIGQTLGASGVVVAFTPAAVRAAAEWAPPTLLLVATLTILLPGALLSAVTPMVTKLRLTDLTETGTIVGSLSGVGTVGAIIGTVMTGFVLIARVPVSAILVGLGLALVLSGIVFEWRLRAWNRLNAVGLTAAVALAGLAAYSAPGGCDAETQYHCVRVVADADHEGGRTLVLDGIRHSYVNIEDPEVLQFAYVRAIASAVETAFPGADPLQAYHLGGGGMTFPRYLSATRPGTQSLVSEIDAGVVSIDREAFGVEPDSGIAVRVEDGRIALRRLPSESRDVVVGDAFGGVSVPWHLTTREALEDVRRVLTDDGVYVANLIDHADLEFVRAETATLATVFANILVMGERRNLGIPSQTGVDGGNFVILASDRPVDPVAVQSSLDARSTAWGVLSGDELTAWIDDAAILTDDFAPVDQLLTPNRPQT